ncbi:MAG: hypothetical protein KatS3mg071_1201 [Meiothermus sp.]|nr:MAG: hypothetical protein KatS3mg071_1201 [Meiothermus sp.]
MGLEEGLAEALLEFGRYEGGPAFVLVPQILHGQALIVAVDYLTHPAIGIAQIPGYLGDALTPGQQPESVPAGAFGVVLGLPVEGVEVIRMVSQLEFQPGAALMLGQLHGSILVERVLKISYELYRSLHRYGFAHSFETWYGNQLAGGILGIALGAAFIGDSMFYSIPNASKVAMVRLVEHLRARGFEIFDVQVQNPHLARFGAIEVDPLEFRQRLWRAIQKPARFVD